jgi:FAD/FMN-containing dehydrogenase
LLRDGTVYITLLMDTANESEMALIDKLTSSAIKRGGTLTTSSRAALDKVSPFLAKRILGQNSLPLQQAVKELFDPNDILLRNQMFLI